MKSSYLRMKNDYEILRSCQYRKDLLLLQNNNIIFRFANDKKDKLCRNRNFYDILKSEILL